MTDRAEQMREAAAKLVDAVAARLLGLQDGRVPDVDAQLRLMGLVLLPDTAAAIRAIPLPPQPPLADDVAGVTFRWGLAEGMTRQEMRDAMLRSAIYKHGDALLIWANEGDLYLAQFYAAEATKQKARAEKAEGERDGLAALSGEDRAAIMQAAHEIEQLTVRAEKAEAEVARLREALEEVMLAFHNVDSQVSDEGKFTERSWEQLRAALTPKGADHE